MTTLIDITGQRFGKLIVLYRFNSLKQGYAQWVCQCDCGNQCVKTIAELKKSKCASCGCYTSELLSKSRALNLIGRRFENLIVVGQEKSKDNRTMWDCRCDCGNHCICSSHSLIQGEKTHCGCKSFEKHSSVRKKAIPSGERFGNLTVLYEIPERRNKKIYYKCKCDCGNIVDVSSTHLKRGAIRSCGCIKSHNETAIKKALDDLNVKYVQHYRDSGCVSEKGSKLEFDFAIFNDDSTIKMFVEYQGVQHFKNSFKSNETNWKTYLAHDELKEKWCLEHGVILLYVTYKDDMEEMLNNIRNIVEKGEAGNVTIKVRSLSEVRGLCS